MTDYEYKGLMAQSWDILRGDTSNWPDRFFFLDIIQKYGQPVLDVGCGTGRLLIDYAQQGIDIDGVDNSPEMLELCQQKSQSLGINPRCYQQTMETLALPRKYRTIMIPSSSIQLLLEPQLVQQAMQRFFDHLEPDGVVVTPLMTLWRDGEPLESRWEKSAVNSKDGTVVQRISYARYDPATSLEHTEDIYQILRDGIVTVEEKHQRSPATRSYTQEQAFTMFQHAGFINITMYHKFTFDPVQPDDSLFTIVGQKPSKG